jgi:tetratricopeptide (TPR) repeat protein
MLERIDKYFNNELSLQERQAFDSQLIDDSELKENVSFYLNTRIAAKQLANDKRKAEFTELSKTLSLKTNETGRIKSIIWLSGLAASVMMALGLWWFSPESMPASNNIDMNIVADTYVQENFHNLPIKMDASTDSLQMGLRLFNEQKLTEAQIVFESILKRKNNDSEALKYAGITALRLKDYDKAIQYFRNLGSQKYLFSNPGKFYEAIALIKKSPEGKLQASELIYEVIHNHLEGADAALEFGVYGNE